MSEQPTVYLSSTFEDLRLERSRVLSVVARREIAAKAMENYGASDEPALKKCIRDVDESDIYVGLIGWRYGFVPPGSNRSITEAEFDAATRAGIPRLMYLLDGPRPESCAADDPVVGFRERISTQPLIRQLFRTEADLAELVTGDLMRELAVLAAKRLPELDLLPYLCDRQPQAQTIVDTIGLSGHSPAVCVLHGPANQEPLRFVDCLHHVHLPECLGADRGSASVYPVTWPYPHRSGPAHAIRLALAKCLRVDVRCTADELETRIREYFAQLPNPALVTITAPTLKLDAQSVEYLRAIGSYFRAWQQSKPELVVIHFSYPPTKPQVEARLKAVIAELENETEALCVLPPLASVGADDATEWTQRQELARVTVKLNLARSVSEIFRDCDELPMGELAPKLHELLMRRAPP